jgi:hypothetical protein
VMEHGFHGRMQSGSLRPPDSRRLFFWCSQIPFQPRAGFGWITSSGRNHRTGHRLLDSRKGAISSPGVLGHGEKPSPLWAAVVASERKASINRLQFAENQVRGGGWSVDAEQTASNPACCWSGEAGRSDRGPLEGWCAVPVPVSLPQSPCHHG